MDSFGIPVVNFGRDCIHAIDSFHEWDGDSSREEVYEGIFMSDFAKGNIVFELGDVIS